jgi:hypothetical protein
MEAGKATPAIEPTPEAADPWQTHEFLDGLYRFYLEKIIGFHTFYLPVVGGVVAYVLAHPSKGMALGLVVPFIVSAGAAQIFFAGIAEAKQLNKAIEASAKEVGILATHARMLVRAVRAFFFLHSIMIIGLLGIALLLFFCGADCLGLPAPVASTKCG